MVAPPDPWFGRLAKSLDSQGTRHPRPRANPHRAGIRPLHGPAGLLPPWFEDLGSVPPVARKPSPAMPRGPGSRAAWRIVVGLLRPVEIEPGPGCFTVLPGLGQRHGGLLPLHRRPEIAGLGVGGSQRAKPAGVLRAGERAGERSRLHGHRAIAVAGIGASGPDS